MNKIDNKSIDGWQYFNGKCKNTKQYRFCSFCKKELVLGKSFWMKGHYEEYACRNCPNDNIKAECGRWKSELAYYAEQGKKKAMGTTAKPQEKKLYTRTDLNTWLKEGVIVEVKTTYKLPDEVGDWADYIERNS